MKDEKILGEHICSAEGATGQLPPSHGNQLTHAAPTPGPWTFEVKDDVDRVRFAQSFGLSTAGLTRCELRTVATQQHTPKLHGPRYLGVIYKEADANLIAAAPELLESLKTLTAMMEDQRDYQLNNAYPEEYAAVATANALIAKAEGKEDTGGNQGAQEPAKSSSASEAK